MGRAFQDGPTPDGRASPLAKQAVGWRGRTIDGSSAHDAAWHVAGVPAPYARTLRPNEEALPLGCVGALVPATGTWSNAEPVTDTALGCRPKDAAGALHRLGLDAPLAEPQAPGASPPENTSRLKLLPGWPPVEGACASDGALKTASASAAGIASVPWWGNSNLPRKLEQREGKMRVTGAK